MFESNRHDNLTKTFLGRSCNWDGPDIITEILVNNATCQAHRGALHHRQAVGVLRPPRTAGSRARRTRDGFAADWDIKPVLQAMSSAPEFYSADGDDGSGAQPVDWIVAVMYYTGPALAEAAPRVVRRGHGSGAVQPAERRRLEEQRLLGQHQRRWVTGPTSPRTSPTVCARPTRMRTLANRVNGSGRRPIDVAIDTIANLFGIAPLSTVSRDCDVELPDGRARRPAATAGGRSPTC